MRKTIHAVAAICLLAWSSHAVAREVPQAKQPPIPWDVLGPGIDASTVQPAPTRSAGVVIYVLTGGYTATEELTSWIDSNGINRQEDGYGNVWTFGPREPDDGWKRMAKVELKAGGPVEERQLAAGLKLTNYLNYKATTAAVNLALPEPKQGKSKP